MDRQVVEVSSLSLSFFLFLWLYTYLPTYLSIYLPTYLSIHPSIHLSIYLICLSNCVSSYLAIYLSICLSVCLSIYVSFCKLENQATRQAILRDFFIFQSWQHQKRSNSARLPHFSTLTTSNTKQFSETSSMFARDDVKNEAILRDFLIFRSWQHQKQSNSARLPSKMESWLQCWRPRTSAFGDFSTPPV